jgi:hypothetical protein
MPARATRVTSDPFAELERVAATELVSSEEEAEFKTGKEVSNNTTRPYTGILTFNGKNRTGFFLYTFTAGTEKHFIVYSDKVLENLRLTNHKFRVSSSEKEGKTRKYYWYE